MKRMLEHDTFVDMSDAVVEPEDAEVADYLGKAGVGNLDDEEEPDAEV